MLSKQNYHNASLKRKMSKSTIARQFGQRVRELRTEQGLSQEALAELAHVHRTFVGRIERGETNLSLENIEKISQGLKISLARLFASFGGRNGIRR